MKIIKHPTKYFITYGCLIASFLFLPAATSADHKKNSDEPLTLSWENPEEGSAVNYNNEDDFTTAPPVLHSSRSKPLVVKTQINMAPVLQRLILPGTENQPYESDDDGNTAELDLGRKAALKALEFYENKVKTVNVNGSVLNIETDCSFFVRAAYWEGSGHTKDLFRESITAKAIELKKATGVTLLASYFEKKYRYQKVNPRVGDIIIFDNTYDKNHNEKRDDDYTHTGIVTNIRPDQTIEFIHGNIGKTIKKGYINFNYKNIAAADNKPVNSYIRPHYLWEKDHALSLASHLVRAFAGY